MGGLLSVHAAGWDTEAREAYTNNISKQNWVTYVCCTAVVALLTDISCQAKVGNFHYDVIAHQDIPCRKVSVHNLFSNTKDK